MKHLHYFILAVTLFVFFSAFSTTANAQNAGSLDTTFGSGGIVNYQLGGSFQYYRGSLVKPDRKIIVVAAYTPNGGTTSKVAVMRFNEDGTFDQPFFNAGFSSDGYIKIANAIALQTDGKILVGGSGFNNALSVIRYNTNGSLDRTFGTKGSANTNFAVSSANSLKILPDGKIFAVGYASSQSGQDYTVVKFNQNGSLDTTFGSGGIVVTDLRLDGQHQRNRHRFGDSGRRQNRRRR